nr:DUF6493 family protein [Streptomyces smaragdinus]
MELVDAGDADGVLRELGLLTLEQRAAYAADLVPRTEAVVEYDRWKEQTLGQKVALMRARLACQESPKAAVAEMLRVRWVPRVEMGDEACGLLPVLDLFPVEWRVEFVSEVSEQFPAGTSSLHYPLCEHIVRTTGCPVPTTDYYINAWMGRHIGSGKPLEGLREDVHTPTLLPLILERPGTYLPSVPLLMDLIAEGLIDRDVVLRGLFGNMADSSPYYTEALKALVLTADERAWMAPRRVAVVETVLSGLLKEGLRRRITERIDFLAAIEPTPDEYAALLRYHVAMLDLSLPVASYGREVLVGLEEAGLLSDSVLAEMCERLLLRSQKKLVRDQLSWLSRVIRRDPARADVILAGVAIAFQHPDMGIQESALKIVARHLKSGGSAVVEELRTAAEVLSPGLTAQAAALFGGPVESAEPEPYEEVLPPVPEPVGVPGPVGSLAEAVQEVAVALANRGDVVAFERALDGLVRYAVLDRAALAEALAAVKRTRPNLPCCGHHYLHDLFDVVTVVRGGPRTDTNDELLPPWRMLMARLMEVMDLLESGAAQPFLLALPTLATGAIDAAVLVERVAELERLGVTPAPVDFAQALLRVGPAEGETVRKAGELRSDAGRWLAEWLRDGGLPHRDSTPEGWESADRVNRRSRSVGPAQPALEPVPAFPPAAAALVGAYTTRGRDYADYTVPVYRAPFWVAQLPHHRDEVAARISTREAGLFPYLAESGGPAGYAMHAQLAERLRTETDAAVEALLVLAAQGALDCRMLGRRLGVVHGLKNVVNGLRSAAESGAYGTVWAVIEGALPWLMGEKPPQEAGAFLVLGVECASRCGAKGSIPEVDAVASRKGSTVTVKNARLLRDVLR